MDARLSRLRDHALRVLETLARRSGEVLEDVGSSIRQRFEDDPPGPERVFSVFDVRNAEAPTEEAAGDA